MFVLGPVIVIGFAILWASQITLGEVLGGGATKTVVAPPAAE